MEKISITLDVSKIDKSKIIERRFTNNQGHEVIVKELKLDIIPLRETKLIREGDNWNMYKTHFVAIPQTKEERENKVKSLIIGNGIMFKNTSPVRNEVEDDILPEDVPL